VGKGVGTPPTSLAFYTRKELYMTIGEGVALAVLIFFSIPLLIITWKLAFDVFKD
jgi:hypothetical protein